MVPTFTVSFLGESSPTKVDYRKKGTLFLTSLLEDLDKQETEVEHIMSGEYMFQRKLRGWPSSGERIGRLRGPGSTQSHLTAKGRQFFDRVGTRSARIWPFERENV